MRHPWERVGGGAGGVSRTQPEGGGAPALDSWAAGGPVRHGAEVRGHRWEFGPGLGAVTLLYEQNPKPQRTCAVCGLVQTQEVGPWK